jgi:hypothetical protein
MDLRPFVFAKLVLFEATFKTEAHSNAFVVEHAQRSLQCVVLEVLRMRWPLRWLSNCLAEFPFYRKSRFARVVRALGIALRKSDLLAIWCGDQSSYFHEFNAVEAVDDVVRRAWQHVFTQFAFAS